MNVRQFLLRALEQVGLEWNLVALAEYEADDGTKHGLREKEAVAHVE